MGKKDGKNYITESKTELLRCMFQSMLINIRIKELYKYPCQCIDINSFKNIKNALQTYNDWIHFFYEKHILKIWIKINFNIFTKYVRVIILMRIFLKYDIRTDLIS